MCLLTDPTFDPRGAEYRAGSYVLRKTQGPALASDALGRIDAVLLSHDDHFDNLDGSGRALLARVPRVLAPRAWEHFSQTRADVEAAFEQAGLSPVSAGPSQAVLSH